jgi:hypothetical protein
VRAVQRERFRPGSGKAHICCIVIVFGINICCIVLMNCTASKLSHELAPYRFRYPDPWNGWCKEAIYACWRRAEARMQSTRTWCLKVGCIHTHPCAAYRQLVPPHMRPPHKRRTQHLYQSHHLTAAAAASGACRPTRRPPTAPDPSRCRPRCCCCGRRHAI